MQYQGGKHFEGPGFAAVLNRMLRGRPYWEPFCGACSVTQYITAPIRRCSDCHPDLILMWQALLSGWDPPKTLSREQWYELKVSEPSALRGFAGFGCSFRGRWFQGYGLEAAAPRARRSLLRKLPRLRDVRYGCLDYREPRDVHGCLIYCDPPYESTKPFPGIPAFDSGEFWEWVRKMSKRNTVVVSSFEAPDDFKSVFSMKTTTMMASGVNGGIIPVEENLFVQRDTPDD